MQLSPTNNNNNIDIYVIDIYTNMILLGNKVAIREPKCWHFAWLSLTNPQTTFTMEYTLRHKLTCCVYMCLFVCVLFSFVGVGTKT